MDSEQKMEILKKAVNDLIGFFSGYNGQVDIGEDERNYLKLLEVSFEEDE